ncbi:E3 ubiquitin-protein ligase TRIM56-like [Huso huso]|uniref:RING-type E3 ubiquitin transferase n=1 Tax=Huso huso TaxID=61971 RepID=A0ABR0ZQ84_HUSHU
MATADPQLSEMIEEEFLKCKICFELYKTPRILPCLHSYCEQCLAKMLEKGQGTICCPECRTKTYVQGNVSNIKTNFYIKGLLDLFESKRNKDAVCSVCQSCSDTFIQLPTLVHSFDTEDMEDEFDQNITGIASFENGDIVIADESNSIVKEFRQNGKTVGDTSVSEECCPCSVTVCGDTVYFSSTTKLYKITGDSDIIQINNLRGSQTSYPIASYKGKYIAVSEGAACTLSLYDPKGCLVDRVKPHGYHGGKFMFLAVNSREEFIVTDKAKKCIVLFTKTGEIINVCSSAGSGKFVPFSVCVDHRDNIYAVESGRIIQLSPKGEFQRVFVDFKDETFRPKLITADAFGHLIVTDKEGSIRLYKIKTFSIRMIE